MNRFQFIALKYDSVALVKELTSMTTLYPLNSININIRFKHFRITYAICKSSSIALNKLKVIKIQNFEHVE